MTAAEARKFLEQHEIEFVLAQFVDIHGSPKAKCVPVAHFEDLLTTGVGFAGFAIWGLGMGPHGPEYTAIGDLSTLTLVPWMPGYARIACDGHVLGKPYEYCPRVALRAQLRKLEALGWTMYTGIEPEFMLLERRRRRHARAVRRHRYARQALLRLQGPRARKRVPRAAGQGAAGGRARRLPDRSRGCERPVRGQFRLSRLPDLRRQLHAVQDGGLRDRAFAGDGLHVHAQAVLESHRHRLPFPYLGRRREAQEPVSRRQGQAGDGPVEDRLPLSRRHSRACARPHRACRAVDQLVQAPGRRPIAFGSDMGAGIRHLRRQQPDGDGQDSIRAARAAAAGWLVQSVSHHGGNHRRRPRWRASASSTRASRTIRISTI